MKSCFWAAGLLLCASLSWSQTADETTPLTPRELQLMQRIDRLEQRLAALEKNGPNHAAATVSSPPPSEPIANAQSASAPATPQNIDVAQQKSAAPALSTSLGGTTINGNLDLYYGYNFNDPIGRVNLLRAYDVSSNSFSLNQAGVVIENAPDVDHGKRWGARLDLQFGQGTQTLQGNPANELRPEIYRNVFQAFGTYILPVGRGLTVDVGKWASSLGIEGNYTKDQMNYSRAFWFQFLPFYHMGVRTNLKLSDTFAVNFWLTNGTQQTEAAKNFKDQLYGFNWQPAKSVNWTVNYYLGQDHPDVSVNPVSSIAGSPSWQGVTVQPIANAPRGKLHIFDTYASWKATPKWTFAGEGDYYIQRLETNSAPMHVQGGSLYAQYALTPKLSLSGRAEYLSDRGGLYSGATQVFRETTFTSQYKLADSLTIFGEWRRDWTNHPYFLTDTLNVFKKEQNQATLGLVWWFGQKEGAW